MSAIKDFLKSQQCPSIENVAHDAVEGIINAKTARQKILSNWMQRAKSTMMGQAGFNQELTGNGIRVAVLDSGLLRDQQIIEGHRLTRHDLIDESGEAEDHTRDKHGSTMAGIIGAKVKTNWKAAASETEDEVSFEGIAPGCHLHIVKCFPGTGRTPWPKIREGLEVVRDYNHLHPLNPIRIVLLAVEEQGGQYGTDFMPRTNDTIANLIRELRVGGVVIVVSSGNQGDGNSSMSYPAILFNDVISVGAIYATTPLGTKRIRKPTKRSQLLPDKTTILAPGWGVKVREGREQLDVKGTSSAAALVAGAIALIMEFEFITTQNYPDFETVRKILVTKNTRIVMDDQRHRPTGAGYPMLDIFRILSNLIH